MAANDRVGDAYIDIKPRGDQFEAGVQSIINRVERGAKFGVGADTTQATEAVNQLANQVQQQVGGAWQQAALQVAGFTAAVYGVRAAVEGSIGKLSGIFDQLATAQAGFSSILKSDVAGETLLNQIREFARVSPFATQELVNYSQQLLGVGKASDTIVPLLERVGDLVASVGGDTQNIGRVLFTLTQIQTIGRLTGQDAMQLQSALIPITKILAENLGKTTAEIKKMQEQGQITSEMVFSALMNAGSEVEGAMAGATRNISGARAILTDTIQIMLQDQPVLQRIFEDTFQGIQAFANFLSSPEFTVRWNEFFESVGSVYDSLQPVFESLTQFSREATFTGLEIFTTVLNTMATVLNSFPDGTLELIGRVLATLALIRAPLMMFQYVQSIQRVTTGLFGANGMISAVTRSTSAIQQEGIAAIATAAQLNQLSLAQQNVLNSAWANQTGAGAGAQASLRTRLNQNQYTARYGGLGLGLGLGVGAQFVQDGEGGGRDAVAGVMQSAAMGSMFGPGGTLVGGAIGAVTAIRNAQEKVKAEFAKNAAEAADEWNKSFRETIDVKFGGDFTSSGALDEYFRNVEVTTGMIGRLQDKLNQTRETAKGGGFDSILGSAEDVAAYTLAIQNEKAALDAIVGNPEYEEFFGRLQAISAQVWADRPEGAFANEIEGTRGIASIFGDLKNAWDEGGLKGVLNGLSEFGNNVQTWADDMPDDLMALLKGETRPQTAEEFKAFADAFAQYGITVEELTTLDAAAITEQIKLFMELPNSWRDATNQVREYNLAVDDAKKKSAEFYDGFQKRASDAGSNISGTGSLQSMFNSISQYNPTSDQIEVNPALQTASGVNQYGQAILAEAERMNADLIANGMDTAEALEISNQQIGVSFAHLQEELGLTEVQFRALIREAGLWDIYNVTQTDVISGTFEEVAAAIGLSADELARILDIQGEIDPYMTVTVDADITQALSKLQRLDDIAGRGVLSQFQIDQYNTLMATLNAAGYASTDEAAAAMQDQERMKREEERLKEEKRQAEERQRELEKQQREAERLAEEERRKQEAWLNAVESATNTMTGALEGAAEAIASAAEAWVGSINERTQYERGVSVTAAIRNADRQIADVTEVTAGIAQLRARGVSQAVLDSLGIDNITDTRQIRRLVNSSDGDLQRLTAAVSERDRLAQSLAQTQEEQRTKRTITEAILDAADALGYDTTKAQAGDIANQFNITANSNADEIAMAILSVLSGGRIGVGT